MADVKFRCPNCNKLFSTPRSQLLTRLVEFRCNACFADFYFDQSAIDRGQVATHFITDRSEADRVAAASLTESGPSGKGFEQAMKTCPKCGALNPAAQAECHSCQVVFAKLRGLNLQSDVKVTPSLVRIWEEVLNDFENSAWHDQFVKACERQGVLPYAESQYRQVLKLTGGDLIAKAQLVRVQSLIDDQEEQKRQAQKNKKHMWLNFLVAAIPLFFSFLTLAVGFYLEASRLYALGMVLLIFSAVFVYLFKNKKFFSN